MFIWKIVHCVIKVIYFTQSSYWYFQGCIEFHVVCVFLHKQWCDKYLESCRILTLSRTMLKMAKHVSKILRCEHCKIFKVCLAIFQDNAWKGWLIYLMFGIILTRKNSSFCYTFIHPWAQDVNWTCIGRSGHLLNVLCTFTVRPVSRVWQKFLRF